MDSRSWEQARNIEDVQSEADDRAAPASGEAPPDGLIPIADDEAALRVLETFLAPLGIGPDTMTGLALMHIRGRLRASRPEVGAPSEPPLVLAFKAGALWQRQDGKWGDARDVVAREDAAAKLHAEGQRTLQVDTVTCPDLPLVGQLNGGVRAASPVAAARPGESRDAYTLRRLAANQYDWLAPKLSSTERKALDAIIALMDEGLRATPSGTPGQGETGA